VLHAAGRLGQRVRAAARRRARRLLRHPGRPRRGHLAPLPGRQPGAGDHSALLRRRGEDPRLLHCAPGRRRAAPPPAPAGGRGHPRLAEAGVPGGHPLRLRRDQAVAAAPRRGRLLGHRRQRRHAGLQRRRPGALGQPRPGRQLQHPGRPAGALLAGVPRAAPARGGRGRPHRRRRAGPPAGRDDRLVAPLVRQHPARRPRRRRGQAVGHHPQGPAERPNRRDRGRAHHQPDRERQRRAQLGLPLQLDPRLRLHRPLAGLARPGHRGGPVPALRRAQRRRVDRDAADRLWRGWRAPAHRAAARRSRGLARHRAGAHRQRRRQAGPARRLRRAARPHPTTTTGASWSSWSTPRRNAGANPTAGSGSCAASRATSSTPR
jgi:hypothetical protein